MVSDTHSMQIYSTTHKQDESFEMCTFLFLRTRASMLSGTLTGRDTTALINIAYRSNILLVILSMLFCENETENKHDYVLLLF